MGVLVLADLMLAWADNVRLVLVGAMMWGLHTMLD
jgi:hypothetical protein